ncbi:MAG: CHASE4 domain-containing protein [Methanosarcinaceae archaeon]|nr:CHASE4 domain-containing protein [Methanosarcinaceae archaeon]
MNIDKKVLVSIFLLFTVFTFVLIYVNQGIIMSNFLELEDKNAKENTDLLNKLIDSEISYMGRINLDWAAWDNTYEFIAAPSPEYINSNLPAGILEDLGLHFIIFADTNGRVVHVNMTDPMSGKEIPLPGALLQMVESGDFLVRDPKGKLEGVVLLGEKPMLVSAFPITTSNFEGPVLGTVIMGRYLDRGFVEKLEKMLNLPVEIRAINGNMPAEFQEAYTKNRDRTYVKSLSEETIAGYRIINDIQGQPAVILKTEMNRDLYAQGLGIRKLIFVFLLSACILAIEGSKVLMERIFISKFLEIESFVTEIGKKKDLSKRLIPRGNDEMTRLSWGINAMMDSLLEAEQEIKDQEREKQEILNSLTELLVFLDTDMKVKWANKEALDYMNADLESVNGKSREEMVSIFGALITNSPAEEALSRGESVSAEVRTACGETWFIKANPVLNDKGQITGILENFLDITERKNYEENVLRAKMAAEAANQTKNAFLANMSHELRTPLNSVIGFSGLLSEKIPGSLNEKQLRYTNNISTSGKHLLRLINDILDLSKVEAGKMEMQYSEFGLKEALEEAKATLEPLAARKELRLEIEVKTRLGVIRADRNKFIQIMYNLLSNAIKFTPKKGLVRIEAGISGTMVKIAVMDSGIGISEAGQKKLFRPFVQLDSTHSREYGGTGLGLTLVKEMVALHGGEVRVWSKEGSGSTFSFTLPINGIENQNDLRAE